MPAPLRLQWLDQLRNAMHAALSAAAAARGWMEQGDRQRALACLVRVEDAHRRCLDLLRESERERNR